MTRLRKSNKYLYIDGQTKPLFEWAEITGNSKQVIWDRLNRMLDEYGVEDFMELPLSVVKDCVFKPARRYRRKDAVSRRHT